ncbi:MAG: YggS family pyridoxal phosphate-dependent enzyme [Elusimicrobiota bacterium]|nr:YggS family pyridoxal phosphate-dependent enzyme [Elusimicrobiota bacterium]
MSSSPIKEKVTRLLDELPPGVELEAACKKRSVTEIEAAVAAGVRLLGQNYIQEARETVGKVSNPGSGEIKWHFIGHLQRNKAKKAVELFDMIESLDSLRLARKLNKEGKKAGKTVSCLVEINSGREENKYGIMPGDAVEFVRSVAELNFIKIEGLMTMGPFAGSPEDFRPYFKTTKKIFDKLQNDPPQNCEMKYLSMGMSASYRTAVEEGANIVRVGTKLFGPRES